MPLAFFQEVGVPVAVEVFAIEILANDTLRRRVFPSHSQAERMLARVLDDEPEWREISASKRSSRRPGLRTSPFAAVCVQKRERAPKGPFDDGRGVPS
jgi:hypothetical protein